ncbi:MAG: TIGR00282 family metallophosphoesterase [Candidatus Brocadiia bacterium]
MKAVFAGDVVGNPGRAAVAEFVPQLRGLGVGFVVVNGENAAGGAGITARIAGELFGCGVDVVTSGDEIFRNKEYQEGVCDDRRVLRPANISPLALGAGCGVYQTPFGPIAVLDLIGRVFMDPAESPFLAADRLLGDLSKAARIIFVDIHAEATSEKIALGWYLADRVTAVVGTHTHIQTADECVLPGGCAYITDLGMTGPYDSVIGRVKEYAIHAFISGMPSRLDVSKNDIRFCGLVVDIDEKTGKATAVKRLQLRSGEKVALEHLP